MALRSFAAAFLLSVLVPLAEGWFPALPAASASGAALALLPWLALATLPRVGAPGDAARAPCEALLAGALALPPLALGAGLDLARGAEPRALAAFAGCAWLALVLWVASAACAVKAARARCVFGALWLALVPGAAALRLALAWVPLRASAEAAEASARAAPFALDPLILCLRFARAPLLAPAELAACCGAAIVVLLATLAAGRTGAEARP